MSTNTLWYINLFTWPLLLLFTFIYTFTIFLVDHYISFIKWPYDPISFCLFMGSFHTLLLGSFVFRPFVHLSTLVSVVEGCARILYWLPTITIRASRLAALWFRDLTVELGHIFPTYDSGQFSPFSTFPLHYIVHISHPVSICRKHTPNIIERLLVARIGVVWYGRGNVIYF